VVKNAVLAFTSGWAGRGEDELLGEAWFACNTSRFLIYFVDVDSLVVSSSFFINRIKGVFLKKDWAILSGHLCMRYMEYNKVLFVNANVLPLAYYKYNLKVSSE
jgi:hypothetical protein